MDTRYCLGHECSVRNTCLRYTQNYQASLVQDLMRKCTSQKKFVQDVSKINQDSKKH